MTFIAVDEIRRRFPNHQIYLLSELDLKRSMAERAQYSFDFMGWYPLKFARCQANPLLRFACKVRNGKELSEAEEIYKHCDAMVDVSGYALGSTWSDATCNRYLDHLEFALAFDIPVYLMPQSFGPFDFGEGRQALNARIHKLLPTAKIIFAREQEGYDALVNTYGLKNVRLAHDLVLSNKGIDLADVFVSVPPLDLPEIKPNSVAVIPNSMNSSVTDQDTVFAIYTNAIKALLDRGKTVYLLSHSAMDSALCGKLKEPFKSNENVILLGQDFSCLEFNELVKEFQYMVASRFHSIVHAFKNGIPCIALGWAAKYHDLLKLFNQEQYVLDVRTKIGAAQVLATIEKMDCHYLEESAKIQDGLAAVQEQNVFDILTQHQKES
ncbi:MAG: polysaccharide pyruvyl transferase family protein [Oscillospiraceae bacterium]|nr:polysaccharide pyruvyl transferase family protein [Oscillospiraceae bacterium]